MCSGCRGNDCVLSVVPMFHANAWGLPYTRANRGLTSRVPRARRWQDPATLADLIESEGVTMAAGVPTVWTGLLAYLEQTGRKLPTFKRTVVGGLGGAAQDDPRVR
jgi:fatty-acyl-CoA synthase